MEQGAPSANGTLNDLASVANAFREWGDRQDAAASAPQPAAEPEPAGEPEPEPQDGDAAPEAEEGVEAEAEAEGEDVTEGEPETDEEAVYEIEVDGKPERFTAAELAANILRQRDYTRKTQELAEGRRLIEAKATEIGNVVRALGSRIQALDAQIKGEDTSAWDEIRRTDPAEWSARMLERRQRIEALHAAQHEYDAQMRRSREENDRREAEILREKIPAWKNGEVARREYQELFHYAIETYGLTPDVLENVASDHRFVLMARDAKQGREATRKADVLKQKVRKLPRVQQPGATGSAAAPKDVAFTRSLDRLRASGGRNRDDAAAAFRAWGQKHNR